MFKIAFQLLVVIFFASLLVACNSSSTNAGEKPSDSLNVSSLAPAEPVMSPKQTLLKAAIGAHALQSIYGSMGANTMFDFVLENGKWSASGSAISNATREAYDIDLSEDALQKLESMKMEVAEDLSVTFSCEEESIYSAPFKEKGMSYFLQKAPGDFIGSIPKELNDTTTISGDYLYLYAKDQIAEADMQVFDFIGIVCDAVLLRYNCRTKEFELTVFYADCCENATLVFK